LRAKELMGKYQKEKTVEYEKTGKTLLSKLAALGISGSAVLPKVEGSREWAEALSVFRTSFENELRTLKEEMRK